jgi:hypothetical protein
MSRTTKRALRIDDPIAAIAPEPADTMSQGEGRLREIAIDEIYANRDLLGAQLVPSPSGSPTVGGRLAARAERETGHPGRRVLSPPDALYQPPTTDSTPENETDRPPTDPTTDQPKPRK